MDPLNLIPSGGDLYSATVIVKNPEIDDLNELRVEVSMMRRVGLESSNSGWLKISRCDEQSSKLFDEAIDGTEALALVLIAHHIGEQQYKRASITDWKVQKLLIWTGRSQPNAEGSVDILSADTVNSLSEKMVIDRIIQLLESNNIPHTVSRLAPEKGSNAGLIQISVDKLLVPDVVSIGERLNP